MDDRFLKYLKEADFAPFIAGDDQPQAQQPTPQVQPQESPIMDNQESLKAAFVAAQDQTQPAEPLDVQAEIQQNPGPTNEKELITDVFRKIGWDKYIKEEPIEGGQNVNG